MATLTNQAKNIRQDSGNEPFFGWLFWFTRVVPGGGPQLSNASKHSGTLTNITKHSASITNQAKH